MVPNTGSLKTCLFERADCIFTENDNPERKLKATLQFLKTPTGWVGVNTGITNGLVYEAWESGRIGDWTPFKAAKREFKISKESRLDLVLATDTEALDLITPSATAKQKDKSSPITLDTVSQSRRDQILFVEIKNVSLCEGGVARFPDAVTTRGQKHLRDLMDLKAKGFGAEICFVVQREDAKSFSPADEIDPEYGRLLREAIASGVKARVLTCSIDPLSGVHIAGDQLPLSESSAIQKGLLES
jgi:sugar fermentation stimulation protein A